MLLLAALALGVPAAAQDRELSTDRPDKTESPFTVPAGRVQIEMDFATYTRDSDRSQRTETVNIAPINLKLGIARDTDVQLVVDSYLHQRTTDRIARTRDTIDGFGDVTIRLKQNFWGNDGGKTAFALMPFLKLPTNSHGLGNNYVEGGIVAPLAIELGGVELGLMTEVDILRKEDDRGYAPTFINSATLSGDLTDKLGMYGEIYTERSTERGADWIATFDTGLTYAVSDDVQLDAGINIGVTHAADDLNLFVGISRRF